MSCPRVDDVMPYEFTEKLLDTALELQSLFAQVDDMTTAADKKDALGQIAVVLRTANIHLRAIYNGIDG